MYTQEDYGVVERLLRPTPERVATAKAWLADRRLASGGTWGPEGTDYEFATEQGAAPPGGTDERDPTKQAALIEWWRWIVALQWAVAELERAGLIVRIVQGRPESPARPGWGFSINPPRIPLGPGDNVEPTPFPTILIGERYGPSLMSAAEQSHRLELYDADLYVTKARLGVFNERARRCVEEALACYRVDLFLAAANMLGAASEAVWHEIAERVATTGDARKALTDELERPSPSIAALQRYVVEHLKQLSPADFRARYGIERAAVDTLAETARYWREVRNYGMHPGAAVTETSFTESNIALQLMGATDYFNRLATVMQVL